MERFQGSPRGVNGILKAANDFVVVGPCCVKGRRRRSLTSALRKVLGVIEVVLCVASFEGCWWYEGLGDPSRC